ncbi:MAG: TIR domain-containing protein [Solirubrobacterales bacterium]
MSSVAEPPAQAGVQKVFICYRREETGAHAGRIYDAMVARFGEENVFMDLELAPGVDFVDRITEVVSGCLALIIVMGPHWTTVEDGTGRRRLDDPEDFVRLEVGNALRRNDVTPIPVLVGGAQMPRPEELPAELRSLTRRNALEMSDGRWRYDVNRLMSALDELLPDREPLPPELSPPPPSPHLGPRIVLEGMLIAGAVAAVGRFLLEKLIQTPDDQNGEEVGEIAEHVVAEVLRRAGTVALVGLALAVWLAYRLLQDNGNRAWRKGLTAGALAGGVGGLIWALPAYIPHDRLEFKKKAELELVAIAASGAILGALIGSCWRPRHFWPGLAAGAVGGLLFQGFVLASGWKNNTSPGEIALSFGLGAAVITGIALATMLLLGYFAESGASHSGGKTAGIRPG